MAIQRPVHRLELPTDARRVGIIADIHGNLPALEAVFAADRNIDWWICAGDVVGYYVEPNDCCELLQSRSIPTVAGNHDLFVSAELTYAPERERHYRAAWTRETLDPVHSGWLASLPQTIEIAGLTGGRVRRLVIRHANPDDFEQYWYPDTNLSVSLADGDILVLGHTHHPMLRRVGNGQVLNPGSVGQPRDRIPGAAFAVIDLKSGEIDFCRTGYDIAQYQTRLAQSGIDPEMIEMLSRR